MFVKPAEDGVAYFRVIARYVGTKLASSMLLRRGPLAAPRLLLLAEGAMRGPLLVLAFL